jgi:nitrite reductase (NADH) small subunit
MPVDVGAADDLVEGAFTLVTVAGRKFGILRWRGEVYALRNSCPHQLGPLCEGRVRPLLDADEPGRVTLNSDTPVVSCPWHGWEFDPRTGESVPGSRYRAARVTVRVDHGRVLLEVRAS